MKESFIAGAALSTAIISGALAAAQQGDLRVVIEGFRNDQGLADVLLFSRESGFPGEADRAYRQLRTKIENGRAVVIFEAVPQGGYAVSALHDEDGDGKMKTNFVGIPQEGFSASNNARGSFGPPAYEDARIELGSVGGHITMKMQY